MRGSLDIWMERKPHFSTMKSMDWYDCTPALTKKIINTDNLIHVETAVILMTAISVFQSLHILDFHYKFQQYSNFHEDKFKMINRN